MTDKYWISENELLWVWDVSEHGISLQDFKQHMIFWQNGEESCTFKKIHDVGKIKSQPYTSYFGAYHA